MSAIHGCNQWLPPPMPPAAATPMAATNARHRPIRQWALSGWGGFQAIPHQAGAWPLPSWPMVTATSSPRSWSSTSNSSVPALQVHGVHAVHRSADKPGAAHSTARASGRTAAHAAGCGGIDAPTAAACHGTDEPTARVVSACLICAPAPRAPQAAYLSKSVAPEASWWRAPSPCRPWRVIWTFASVPAPLQSLVSTTTCAHATREVHQVGDGADSSACPPLPCRQQNAWARGVTVTQNHGTSVLSFPMGLEPHGFWHGLPCRWMGRAGIPGTGCG